MRINYVKTQVSIKELQIIENSVKYHQLVEKALRPKVKTVQMICSSFITVVTLYWFSVV